MGPESNWLDLSNRVGGRARAELDPLALEIIKLAPMGKCCSRCARMGTNLVRHHMGPLSARLPLTSRPANIARAPLSAARPTRHEADGRARAGRLLNQAFHLMNPLAGQYFSALNERLAAVHEKRATR